MMSDCEIYLRGISTTKLCVPLYYFKGPLEKKQPK